ncbi:MAG: TonB-dependent receptor [Rhodothermales bacterium]
MVTTIIKPSSRLDHLRSLRHLVLLSVIVPALGIASLPIAAHGQTASTDRLFELALYGTQPPGRLARPVTLDGAENLATIIRSIANQADLSITFDTDRVNSAPARSVHFVNVPAATVLVDVLTGTGLHALVSPDWSIVIVPRETPDESSGAGPQTRTQTIRGVVIDRHTQLPLPGASVAIVDLDPMPGTITDADGRYVIEHVPFGRHDIEARFLGYETTRRTGVLFSSAKEVVLNFELSEQVLAGEDVIVTPREEKDRPVNEMAMVSARPFTVEETRRYAGGADDPARMASAFAGVATSGDVSDNSLTIRGNAPKGVLWRLEGVEIPNPNHFAEVNIAGGGGITIFSSQLLDNSDFLTGAFPAEYGNALAGVFDIHMRRGNTERREHTAQVGILGIDFATEGPFRVGASSSYLINYRYSTLGLLAPLLPIDGLTTYQDLSFKNSFSMGPSGRLDVWGIGGLDLQKESPEPDPADWRIETDAQKLRLSLGMGAAGINYRHVLGNRTFAMATVALTGTRTHLDQWQARVDTAGSEVALTQTLRVSKSRVQQVAGLSLNHKFSTRLLLDGGVRVKRFSYDVANAAVLLAGSALEPVSSGTGSSFVLTGYEQTRVELSRAVTFDAGLHAQYFDLNGELSLEPRAAVRFAVDDEKAFTAGYGLHSQTEDLQLYLATPSGLSASEQALNNRDLRMTKAHHLVIGYQTALNRISRARIETYYQYLFDVPTLETGSYSVLNFSQDFEFDGRLVNLGAGRNYGIDVTVERFLRDGYYFLVTGSVFRSMYRGGDGIWRRTRYDQRFTANALAGREFVLRDGGAVLGINARIGSTGGSLRRPIDWNESLAQRTVVFDDRLPFVERNPIQTIVDVTVTYRINRRRTSSVWALQVKNALAQGLPYFEYDFVAERLVQEKDVIVLPILSWKIEF